MLEKLYKEHSGVFKFLCAIGILTIIVILICITFRFSVPFGKIDNDGLVIAFIGVLATFIVIGNYAQISHIEDKFEKAIDDYEKTIYGYKKDIEDYKNGINGQINRIPGIEHSLEEDSIRVTYCENGIRELQEHSASSQPLTKKELASLLKLFIGKEGDVRKYMQLYAKMTFPNSRYMVELNEGQKTQITIQYDESKHEVFFIKSKFNEIRHSDIKLISGLPFHYEDISFAYKLLNEINTGYSETYYSEINKEDDSETDEASIIDQIEK